MKKLAVFLVFIAIVLVAVITFSRSLRNGSNIRFRVMGTDAVITVNDKGAWGHLRAARNAIRNVSSLMDLYNTKSDVSLINRCAGISGVKVAQDTFSVIEQALFVSRLTKGAFDITLHDFNAIQVDNHDKSVFLKEAGAKIDLGGIGKGYAVEKARKVLLERGVTSALIDMHSSIAAIGGPWKIGIRDPSFKDGIIDTVVLNNGEALSTSGNYEQGKHIVNPRLGKLVDTCKSVTVIAKDAGFADALSTAIYAMGPKDGLSLVKSMDQVRALIVTSSGDVLKSWQ